VSGCGRMDYGNYPSAPTNIYGSCYAGVNLIGPKYVAYSSKLVN